MSICYKWIYEFNHSKSGIGTSGESKQQHFEPMKNREWLLGDTTVDEFYEYKNSWRVEKLDGLVFLKC